MQQWRGSHRVALEHGKKFRVPLGGVFRQPLRQRLRAGLLQQPGHHRSTLVEPLVHAAIDFVIDPVLQHGKQQEKYAANAQHQAQG